MLAHPKPNPEFALWFDDLLASGAVVLHAEIADYEVRRNLLLTGLTESLKRLDELKQLLLYLPLRTEDMLLAAQFWAESRKRGRPTADPKELNGDVILAAQALRSGATIVTDNVGHLA